VGRFVERQRRDQNHEEDENGGEIEASQRLLSVPQPRLASADSTSAAHPP
jgi:hypothetical protein